MQHIVRAGRADELAIVAPDATMLAPVLPLRSSSRSVFPQPSHPSVTSSSSNRSADSCASPGELEQSAATWGLMTWFAIVLPGHHVRLDDPIGPGTAKLRARPVGRRASNDHEVGSLGSGREGDEHVLLIGVRTRDEGVRGLDTRSAEIVILGPVPVDELHARRSRPPARLPPR